MTLDFIFGRALVRKPSRFGVCVCVFGGVVRLSFRISLSAVFWGVGVFGSFLGGWGTTPSKIKMVPIKLSIIPFQNISIYISIFQIQ